MKIDPYKIYKSIRKVMPPQGKVILPKNLYNRRDKTWKNAE